MQENLITLAEKLYNMIHVRAIAKLSMYIFIAVIFQFTA